ncbi:MAG: methyltransferase domain-containing protein [Hydrogenophilales bacterium]|nr:methyltransferase domain-containing protein [Hydrogenophilales bacterium]
MDRDAAFFDGITIEVDRITDPRWDRVLPILEEEQVYMCRMMEPLLRARPGARVLDVGTGSGVFAIYAAKHGCRVVAIDISPRALRFARHNAKNNGIQTVDGEPGVGEVQFLRHRYEQFSDENRFDIVFLAPPYNPTCDGFKPALHADAGKLGQDLFRDQVRHTASLLKRDGVCIGNQMFTVDNKGSLDCLDDLKKSYPGGEFHYLRIISEDIPVRDFLGRQYATYRKSELKLSPSPADIEKYISNFSNDKFFALVYYELSHSRGSTIESKSGTLSLTETKSAIPAPKGWDERIKLHRRIIEHTSLEYSFPAPALFLDIDALPNFPERGGDDPSPNNYWNGSVLRYIESWLAKPNSSTTNLACSISSLSIPHHGIPLRKDAVVCDKNQRRGFHLSLVALPRREKSWIHTRTIPSGSRRHV